MSTFGARTNRLRIGKEHGRFRVTYAELFFDLVFASAVTQLSHGLLTHPDSAGALQMTFLVVAVWWVWITATWMTNWLDPERQAVRVALFVMMGVGMVLSSSIPHAFGERAIPFAWSYVTMQMVRTLFMLWSLRRHRPVIFRSFLRMLAWLLPAAMLWIVGAHSPPDWRLPLWAAALCIEAGSPWWGFWTPGLGRSSTTEWDVEGGHLSERCALFVIIALGESILVTGSSLAKVAWSPTIFAAFVLAFLGAVAMWWIYFAIGAKRASRVISRSSDPGRLARSAYTYMHVPIVAGIVLAAVANELVLARPTSETNDFDLAAIVGGPALYLLGNAMFKYAVSLRLPLSHVVGVALLGIDSVLLRNAPALLLLLATTLVLVGVAACEWLSLSRSRPKSMAWTRPL